MIRIIFLLSVTNSYSGKLLKTKDHRLKITKTDTENHGVGLASVYRAVAKYCGTIIIDDSVSGQFKIRYCYTETRNNYISSRNYYNKNIDY